jgi:hypothetical protein
VNDIDIGAITPWLEILWEQKGSGRSLPLTRIRGAGKLFGQLLRNGPPERVVGAGPSSHRV